MSLIEIDDGLWLVDCQHTLTGVLRRADEAVLINAPHSAIAGILRDAGISRIAKVFLLHHRRELAAGLPGLMAMGSPRIVVPEAERPLFEDPASYWAEETTRWRLLCGHVPHHSTHVSPLPVAETLTDGDVRTWADWELRTVATPGYTDGSVSLLVRRRGDGPWQAFVGDLVWGPGMIRDIHSLQHRHTRNGHRVGDYHGFMGAMWTVLDSLDRLLETSVARMIPAHGEIVNRPRDAADLLRARFHAAYHNYQRISALRWYFPDYFLDHGIDADTLPMQETIARPSHVVRFAGTTWALLAADRHALLIDPCSASALSAAEAAVESGEVNGFDAIWLTHYHHDHVEAAQAARDRFGIPIMADCRMAEVVSHPERFFLTCLSPIACTVDRATEDGETWAWRDQVLTAYHFPGQTLYHGGLLARPARGPTLFFAGDAVTPTGIDDYCAWNRNWLGADVGFDRCLRLLRLLDPDIIFNQHVDVGFRFDADAYDLMLNALRRREDLFRDLMPWDHPNVGTDACWVHTYPYEQEVRHGRPVVVNVRLTNHADRAVDMRIRPHLPEGWTADAAVLTCRAEPKRPACCRFMLAAGDPGASGRCVVPFDVTVDNMYLGSITEAVLVPGD